MSLHVHVVETAEGLESLRDAWGRLDAGVPFRSFDWLTTWWKHYGITKSQRRELFVLVVRTDGLPDDQQVLAIAPWYVERTRTRGQVVKWLGSGEVCSDHLTILCEEQDQTASVEAVARYLVGSSDWNRLDLDGIDQSDQTVAELAERLASNGCAASTRPEGNCWSIDLPEDWEAYLATLSKSHRKQIRRSDRAMLQTGQAEWRLVKTPDQLNQHWDSFVDLHQRRRQSLGEPGCFASESFAAFHREVAEKLLGTGNLRLSFLDIDGRPAAVEYQFAGGGSVFAYQGGFDPELLDREPGRLSLIATIRATVEDGYSKIDFLRGDEPYKAHWRAVANPTYRLKVLAPSYHTNWLAQSVDLAESLARGLKSRLQPLVGSFDSRLGTAGS